MNGWDNDYSDFALVLIEIVLLALVLMNLLGPLVIDRVCQSMGGPGIYYVDIYPIHIRVSCGPVK